MDKIRLGRSELWVTQIGFGAIPIQRLQEAEAVDVVQHCLERGINFLDTANAYTTSEERIGKAIAGRRDGLVLATKSTARDRAGVLAHLELSLQRLGVDYIDLYQLHNVSRDEDLQRVLAPGGALEAAQQAQQEGKVGHIGVTSHAVEIAQTCVRSGLFETILFPLNFVAREPGEEIHQLALEHDVGFIAMKPLGGGMLPDVRLCFKYLLQFPQVACIPGIEKTSEIDEILQIVSEPAGLSAQDLAEIERIRAGLGNRFCRRCDYCQPCPQAIPISQLTTATGMLRRMPVESFLRFTGPAAEKAAADCQKCGECEERCPYGLPIREMMDEAISVYWREKEAWEKQLAVGGSQ